MEERRDPDPRPDTRRRGAVTAGRLSPLQEAWGAYVEHATHCDACRSLDAGRCEPAQQLWRAYQAQGEAAYREISGP
jgi:hypothetical protein